MLLGSGSWKGAPVDLPGPVRVGLQIAIIRFLVFHSGGYEEWPLFAPRGPIGRRFIPFYSRRSLILFMSLHQPIGAVTRE